MLHTQLLNDFWEWFTENSELYFEPDSLREKHFECLLQKLKRIDKNLTFEIGPLNETGKRQLIISANGILSSFTSVMAMVEKAPSLTLWEVLPFRQRKPDAFDEVRIGNISVKKKDVFFKYAKDFGKIELELFIDGYKDEDDTYKAAAFIILDHVLGEYDTEMKISSICFHMLDELNHNGLFPIDKLPELVDEYKLEFNN
ncbi:MAG: hypothetical protein JJU28_18430 [Cyclobacteriaceae bacterium]|nr:hypothetical protein [Cyclobacteriaceae bacterium]